MGIDIRVLPEEDVERWKQVEGVAFVATPEVVERETRQHKPEWTLAAYVDGELQAAATSIPYTLGLEGNEVRMGGVTSVACMPEYRRQGLVAELLRETLKRSHDLGEPLSGLWTPHPALYRRYGWEIVTESYRFNFDPKRLTLEPGPPPAGRVREVPHSEWRLADRVYKPWAARRNSVLVRDELRWLQVLSDPARKLYVYSDENGEAKGHAVMTVVAGRESSSLVVHELVALTGDAYRGLLALVLSHDLSNPVHLWASTDEPLLDIALDPRQVTREPFYGLLLRVVDVEEAFAARPAYAEGRVVVRLVDEACAWNDGIWEIGAAGSRLSAERCDDAPMLTVDARALAQLYNGFRSATNLARAGRIESHHPRALAIADVLFAMRTVPFCTDEF